MRRSFGLVLASALTFGILLLASGSPAQEAVKDIPKGSKKNKYIGAKKCKNCHEKDSTGNQYQKWVDAKHSGAFKTLGTDEAKKQGAERGVSDPQKDPKCLKCHVTGYGEDPSVFAKSFKAEDGVQCETCHGPGSAHFKARFAAAAKAKGDERQEVPAGELVVRPDVSVCLGCHNEESPSFKGFCFKERVTEILHHDPRKKRSQEELDALKCKCGEPCKCTKADCGGWPESK